METQKWYIASNKYSIHERQTKKNGKVYDIVFRIIDKDTLEPSQKKISGFKTKRDAKDGYNDFVSKYCEYTRMRPQKQEKKSSSTQHTVRDMIELYLTTLDRANKESTIFDKKNVFDVYFLPKIGEVKIADMNIEFLQNWQKDIWNMKKKNGEYYSYSYCIKIRSRMSALLEFAATEYGYTNYMPKVKRPKRETPKPVMQIWEKDKIDKFLSSIDDIYWHTVFAVMFYTGRRKSEIMALTIQDYDKKKQTLTFDKQIQRRTIDGSVFKITPTKEEKYATVPICNKVKQALDEYINSNAYPIEPFLFGGDKPIPNTSLARKFQELTVHAGYEKIRIHDIRHSFVSMLIHLGVNMFVIADLISDTVQQVTDTYGQLYISDKYDAIHRIDADN